jgi:hypothetical protein
VVPPLGLLIVPSGDFQNHCDYLAETVTGFTTWAKLQTVQEAVYPPSLDIHNRSSVVEHCYSSLRRILNTIDSYMLRKPYIHTVYFLHDGAWDHLNVYLQVYKLETALKDADHFKRIGSPEGPVERVVDSGMIPVKKGERDWKVAVDVELARRADVFIGNGYSSLSSQIIALRLADGGSIQDIGLF